MSELGEQVRRLGELRVGLSDGNAEERELQWIADGARRLQAATSQLEQQLAANSAAGLDVGQMVELIALRTEAKSLQATLTESVGSLTRDSLDGLVDRAEKLKSVLEEDGRHHWSRKVSDVCGPAVVGLLEACAELKLSGATELAVLVPRLQNSRSPSKELWERLADFSQRVEEFISATTNDDPEIRDSLVRLVGTGLSISEAVDPTFSAWLSAKGLVARLRVTIR